MKTTQKNKNQKFDIIILNTDNELLPLTVNSLLKNTPGFKFSIIKCENNKKINAALSVARKPSIVISSGIICELNKINTQYDSFINSQIPLYLTRKFMFAKDKYLQNQYEHCNVSVNRGVVDLNFFIINPSLINYIPEVDNDGFLSKVKITDMPPLYLHKEDMLVDRAFDAKNCLNYGVRGIGSFCHDYRKYVKTGVCSVPESWAYNFSRLLNYTDHLDYKYIRNIEKISKKEFDTILNLKTRLHNEYLPVNNGKCLKSKNSIG